jgi:hypothetical protein
VERVLDLNRRRLVFHRFPAGAIRRSVGGTHELILGAAVVFFV